MVHRFNRANSFSLTWQINLLATQTTLLREDIRSHKENSQSLERSRSRNFHFQSLQNLLGNCELCLELQSVRPLFRAILSTRARMVLPYVVMRASNCSPAERKSAAEKKN